MMTYDFSRILPQTARPSVPMQVPANTPALAPRTFTRSRLYFESSRAGGTFSAQNHARWNADRNARFKQWKSFPEQETTETEAMATEISTALLSMYGGCLPPLRFTSPPRGKTPPDQPHAAQVLAKAIAKQLNRPYDVCVQRATPDLARSRSRYENLHDESRFVCVQRATPDLFTIVIDDVSTTGNTLNRMRTALTGVPTLCFVYVIWH